MILGDRVEMQGMVVEDNHLVWTGGGRILVFLSLVSFDRLEVWTSAH